MINALADSIIARLAQRTDFRGWKVEHYPDVQVRKPPTTPMQLLVSYEGSSDGDLESLYPASTTRVLTWAVTISTRGLRGNQGAQASIDAVRRALLGWVAPQGGTPFAPTKDGFVDEADGVWRHVVEFRMSIPCVADPEAGNEPPYQPSGQPGSDTEFSDDLAGELDTSLLNNR